MLDYVLKGVAVGGVLLTASAIFWIWLLWACKNDARPSREFVAPLICVATLGIVATIVGLIGAQSTPSAVFTAPRLLASVGAGLAVILVVIPAVIVVGATGLSGVARLKRKRPADRDAT